MDDNIIATRCKGALGLFVVCEQDPSDKLFYQTIIRYLASMVQIKLGDSADIDILDQYKALIGQGHLTEKKAACLLLRQLST